MNIPAPHLRCYGARCAGCRFEHAIIVAIRFPGGHVWIVDGECSICGYDYGERLERHYPVGKPITGPRKPLIVIPQNLCWQDTCLSDFFEARRGDEIVAGSCSSPTCGYYVLPSGVREAYADYVGLTLYGAHPFGQHPNDPLREAIAEVDIDI